MESKPRKIVHLHVPKTAGTALRSAFQNYFGKSIRTFTEFHEDKYKDINPQDFDFFSGHFGYETANRLDGDIVTVLRDPIERVVSIYYFWRQLFETGTQRSVNTTLASTYSLEHFMDLIDQTGLVLEFHNRCVWQIAAGTTSEHRRSKRLAGWTDDDLFATAVKNLETFKVVGIQEDLAGFSEDLIKAFGVHLNIKKINVTKKRDDLSSLPASVKRKIQNWVYMDIELYHHVLKGLAKSK